MNRKSGSGERDCAPESGEDGEMLHRSKKRRLKTLRMNRPESPQAFHEYEAQAQHAIRCQDWKSAASYYAKACARHAAELALINSVQEGLSSRLDTHAIYDLVGDKLRDTFNAQVVMISQYDPQTNKIFHHYANERGRHLHIQGWQPIDSSRAAVIRTGKPFMINQDEIVAVIKAEKMHVVPGTELPKCWLGVPMLVGDEARGIVSLQNLDKENAFSPADIDLLTTLTNSMSLSLENARLFNETQRLLRLSEEEMQIARQTQLSILPIRLPRHTGYDFGSLIMPARAMGGDFYDFIQLGNNQLCIVIGDASDKGLPAALLMALTVSLLRTETGRTENPLHIIRNVNRYLLNMNFASFVTLLYSVLDCANGALTYSRAGHILPIILDGQGQFVNVTMSEGQPLGLFEDVKIDRQRITIPRGGLALLHSDGLNEAADGQGVEFGFERIKDELLACRHESARTICDRLWTAVQNYSGDMAEQDDFTALVIKRD
jgi:serine phosphatase RsbU (regulator of sigma subunit)